MENSEWAAGEKTAREKRECGAGAKQKKKERKRARRVKEKRERENKSSKLPLFWFTHPFFEKLLPKCDIYCTGNNAEQCKRGSWQYSKGLIQSRAGGWLYIQAQNTPIQTRSAGYSTHCEGSVNKKAPRARWDVGKREQLYSPEVLHYHGVRTCWFCLV